MKNSTTLPGQVEVPATLTARLWPAALTRTLVTLHAATLGADAIAHLLGITAYEAFAAGARIRSDEDLTAIAATMPASDPAANLATAREWLDTTTHDLATDLDVTEATAAGIHDLAESVIRQASGCPAWCTLAHDAGDDEPDKRHHAGDVAELRMLRHAPGRFHDSRPVPVALVALSADPCCHPGETVIELGLAWEQPDLLLTPGEARALADQLERAADRAEYNEAPGGAR